MRLILFGFLRRWWAWYLASLLLATACDLAHNLLPFPYVPYLFAPWLGGLLMMLDLASGAPALTVALPVTRACAGRAYWIAGVCFPPLLVALAQCLAWWMAAQFGIHSDTALLPEPGSGGGDLPFGIPNSSSLPALGINLSISIVLSGFSLFALTLMPFNALKEPGDSLPARVWSVFAAFGILLIFGASIFSSCGMPMILNSVKGNPAAILALIGLGCFFLVYRLFSV